MNTIEQQKESAKLPISQGYFTTIDAEDVERLSKWKWSVQVNRGKPAYVRRSQHIDGKVVTIYLHRFLLNAPDSLQVDHRNGDGLDNRKANLRLATVSQNCTNRLRRRAVSSYRGVQPQGSKFRAAITVNRETLSLGLFQSAEAAARAYDSAAVQLHGEFAKLNFIHEGNIQFSN